MSNEAPKKTSGLTIVLIIIILFVIVGILDHVGNQLRRTDTITNLFFGALLCGAIVLSAIYFSKNK